MFIIFFSAIVELEQGTFLVTLSQEAFCKQWEAVAKNTIYQFFYGGKAIHIISGLYTEEFTFRMNFFMKEVEKKIKRKGIFEPPQLEVQGWVGRAASLQRPENAVEINRVNFARSKFALFLRVSLQVSGNGDLVAFLGVLTGEDLTPGDISALHWEIQHWGGLSASSVFQNPEFPEQ